MSERGREREKEREREREQSMVQSHKSETQQLKVSGIEVKTLKRRAGYTPVLINPQAGC